ncbi:hypothetical protein GCM10023083_71200 [Streptomyces phyllanthi]
MPRIQSALLDEDEDENAQEYDGGNANGHRAPPADDEALLPREAAEANRWVTGAGCRSALFVWGATTWTPGEGISGRFVIPWRDERQVDRMITLSVGSSLRRAAGVPTLAAKRPVHTFRG